MSLGAICVEHLKTCTKDEWDGLFSSELVITKIVAARVFASLKRGGVLDPKKGASQLGISQASVKAPTTLCLTNKGNVKDNGSSQVKLDGYLERMNKWFYYGFVKRFDLSDRNISAAGQKLPNNWENALVGVRGKVRARQKPETKLDGSTRIAGVRDAQFCNTYHVPLWYESVFNYTWGNKSGGVWHIRTGGKEKDRFTTQLHQ